MNEVGLKEHANSNKGSVGMKEDPGGWQRNKINLKTVQNNYPFIQRPDQAEF